MAVLRGPASGAGTGVAPASVASQILDGIVKRGLDPFRIDDGDIVRIANGNGQVIVSGSFSAVNGTDGDDLIWAGPGSSIKAGGGNDSIRGIGLETVDGGDGDDDIQAHFAAQVYGGAGNDVINADRARIVDGGAGNDTIDAHGALRVFGGAGTDVIRASGAGVFDGGDGNDTIRLSGAGNVAHGGSGDDIIRAHGSGNIVSGGTGNDRIELTGWSPETGLRSNTDATVKFAAGDGKDSIRAGATNLTIALGEGMTAENTVVTITDNKAVIRFANSEADEITVELFPSSSLALTFADGGRRDVRQGSSLEFGSVLKSFDNPGPAAVVAAYREH